MHTSLHRRLGCVAVFVFLLTASPRAHAACCYFSAKNTDILQPSQKVFITWDPKEKGTKRYKELTDSTLVVIIAMLLLGGYVALFDFILVNVIHFFTRL